MTMIVILLVIMIGVLLFLYGSLKYDLKELHKQIIYSRLEESTFSFYTTSSDASMHKLCEEVNALREHYIKECCKYIDMDQNFKKMITNISHDIRTPLTSINGYLVLLEECKEEEKKEAYTIVINQRIAYLKNLLEELFLYTRITNDSIDYEITNVCAYDILCDTLLHFYTQFKEKNINVRIDVDEERVDVVADVFCLERVFNNLFNNVVRHGIHEVYIKEECSEENVYIHISNDTYEKELDVNALFQRFYTADKSRHQQHSGLGLAIVKELVEKMGGRVEAILDEHRLCITVILQKGKP